MIQIIKGPCPKALSKRGPKRLKEIIDAYNRGDRRFTFKATYRMKSVAKKLKKVQHNKCCFSEAYFVGDLPPVEHFRPKGRIDSWPYEKGKSITLGYYWLAYEWDNLMLSKPLPNSKHKRNFFPLLDETKRMKHHTDTNLEEPILINPSIENPRDHIKFRGWEITGITERGVKSIEILGLRDESFTSARTRTYKNLKDDAMLVKGLIDKFTLSIDDPILSDVVSRLRLSVTPSAEFSSMAIDFLTTYYPDLITTPPTDPKTPD